VEKSLFEQMGGTYRQVGDYLIPNLELPPQDNRPIGIWGQRHLRYIKQNKKSLYIELKMSGKLNDHLADVNEEAEEMFSRLVKQMAEKQGVTEQLKAENQMNWVGRMNCIRNQATEIINNELIYA
jgi:hypothetical protein